MAKKKNTKKSAKEELKEVIDERIGERIIFENRRVGVQVDAILNEEPKHINIRKIITGNGGVGLCEKFRFHSLYLKAIWWVIGITWAAIIVLFFLVVSGDYRGLTPEEIREAVVGERTEQVEPSPEPVIDQKPIIIIEENKPEIVVPLPVEPEEIIEEKLKKDVINKEE